MLFSRLSLSLLATLPTRVFCDEYPVNANGNLVLQSTDVHISWGNHKPLDVLERLREKCPEDGIGCCKATNVELDTQVTIDGRSYMRTLSVTINEASYVPGATGGFSQLLKALQALVDSEPWTVFTSKVHWDQDTEQSSCTRNNNNYCWIPNQAQGDTDQWSAPQELWARYQDPGGEASHIQLMVTVKEQAGGPWDCSRSSTLLIR